VLAGATFALAVGIATGAPLGIDVAAGALAAIATLAGLVRFLRHHYGNAPDIPMFPSAG
jgi:hypothetical protein